MMQVVLLCVYCPCACVGHDSRRTGLIFGKEVLRIIIRNVDYLGTIKGIGISKKVQIALTHQQFGGVVTGALKHI